jgi:hypothetical protein
MLAVSSVPALFPLKAAASADVTTTENIYPSALTWCCCLSFTFPLPSFAIRHLSPYITAF